MTIGQQRWTGRRPGSKRRRSKNRWSRALDESPGVGTLASSFGAYLAGAVLLIGSVFVLIAGVLLVTGSMGSGWQGRVTGLGLIIGGAIAFAIGRWTTDQYLVQ